MLSHLGRIYEKKMQNKEEKGYQTNASPYFTMNHRKLLCSNPPSVTVVGSLERGRQYRRGCGTESLFVEDRFGSAVVCIAVKLLSRVYAENRNPIDGVPVSICFMDT